MGNSMIQSVTRERLRFALWFYRWNRLESTSGSMWHGEIGFIEHTADLTVFSSRVVSVLWPLNIEKRQDSAPRTTCSKVHF